MPAALLRKVDLTVRRRIDGLLAGDHRSWALGDGTELAQVRPYVPGDDVRLIDWNVTARTGEPHVRVHVAERAVETWLLLDTSAVDDLRDGRPAQVGRRRRRRARARPLRRRAAATGSPSPRSATATLSRRPPGRATAACSRSCSPCDGSPTSSPSGPTSLGTALARLGRLARRRAVIVVVSDFRGPRDWRPHLLRLAARHDVVAVEIRDPREQELPDVGDLWLVDPESGRQLRVDTREPQAAAAFRRRWQPPSARTSPASCARSASPI